MKRKYSPQQVMTAVEALICIALIGAVLLTFRIAYGADDTPCLRSPVRWEKSHERFGWRIVDGQKCWFTLHPGEKRGRDRNPNSLFWEKDEVVPMTINPNWPWDQEYRFQGAKPGWDHKE